MKIPIEVTSSANTSGLKDAARDVKNLGDAVRDIPKIPNIGAAPGSGGAGVAGAYGSIPHPPGALAAAVAAANARATPSVSSVAAQVNSQVNQHGSLSAYAAAQQQGGSRSNNFDLYLTSSATLGAGRAGMQFTQGNVQAYMEEETRQFGARGSFGADAPAVIASAKRTASDMAGVDVASLLQYVTQLKEAGVATNRVEQDVVAVSDALAKAGTVGGGVMQKMITNLSQIQGSSKLIVRDLNELDHAGIAGTRRIAEGLGISQGELRERMSKGEVSGTQAYNAFISQAQEEAGGTGKRMTEQTLSGSIEKTRDEFKTLQSLMGEGVAPAVGAFNSGLRTSIEYLQAHPMAAKGLGIAGAVGGGGLAAAGAAGLGVAGLRTVGQAIPALQGDKDSGLRHFLFNGARGASPTNPMFVQPVGGSLGAPGESPASQLAASSPSAAGVPWHLRPIGPQFEGPVGMRGATMGSAGVGLALGIGAGLGAREDYGSDAAGLGVGLSAAALAAFNPAAAALIGAAELLRAGQKSTNDNEDARLEAGNGLSPAIQEANKGNSVGDLIKRRDEWFNLSKEQRGKANDARGGFYGTGFDPLGAHARLGEQYDLDAQNSQMEGGKLNRKITAAQFLQMNGPDQATISRSFEDKWRADPANFNRAGQDSGRISNSPFGSKNEGAAESYDGLSLMEPRARRQQKAEVQSVRPEDGGWTTLTIRIPTHPDVMRLVNDFDQATRP